MGLEAIYPKKRLSIPSEEGRRYSYLLRNLAIKRPDHVWCADITICKDASWVSLSCRYYDWYRRYVLSWGLSNSLDKQFCLDALNKALTISRTEIFNSDQGSQFTSNEFTRRLESMGIKISMDGRGRFYDNIFIERLWRTVKYEEVYLHSYESVKEAHDSLSRYFQLYNTKRLHEALGYRTPHEV